MPERLLAFLDQETVHLQQAGLFRSEPVTQPAADGKLVLRTRKLVDLTGNDYLGYASHSALRRTAKQAIDEFGLGPASPRALTGTTALHIQLERAMTEFFGSDESVVFASRYQANTGLFESLLGERDFVFCDALCHPSLADGVRLSRARVLLYRNNDLRHLEDRLKRSRAARFRVIATDGVFATEGALARLEGLTTLAAKYDALLVMDDSHGVGLLGPRGRGSHEQLGVLGKIDLVTGSFSHALGSSGGFVSGRRQLIAWLRQKARPYLVASPLAPASAAAALRALALVDEDPAPRQRLLDSTRTLRAALGSAGFDVIDSLHPMVVVRVGDVLTTQKLVNTLHQRNFYAVGLCYPVVPEGEARIRLQLSALHSHHTLESLVGVLKDAGRELRII